MFYAIAWIREFQCDLSAALEFALHVQLVQSIDLRAYFHTNKDLDFHRRTGATFLDGFYAALTRFASIFITIWQGVGIIVLCIL